MLMLLAAPDGAFYLVIDNTKGGVATVEYPNATRCERARRAVMVEAQKRVDTANKDAAKTGGIISDYGPMPVAYCIPA